MFLSVHELNRVMNSLTITFFSEQVLTLKILMRITKISYWEFKLKDIKVKYLVIVHTPWIWTLLYVIWNRTSSYMIWGSHGGERKEVGCLLSCSALWTGVDLPDYTAVQLRRQPSLNVIFEKKLELNMFARKINYRFRYNLELLFIICLIC
jgi:hypothetical protein